ncbi:MAG: AtpZ/AtpI family protein [Dehalococcoidia bacterium]|jgi:F0F1-type ATP synthase assembly protein I|nr:AtpZ/AtpI family protein [Dehalococcoidia bacterium]
MNRRLLALRLTGLGWYVATCIVVGVVGGVLMDEWLGTKLLFTLLGLALGTTSAFYGLIKMIQPLIKPEPLNGENTPGSNSQPDKNSKDIGGNP